MKSDLPIYVGIVFAIAAFVLGFTAWKLASPASRRPEKALCLLVAVVCGATFVWTSVQAYLVWRDTGIGTMRGDYGRLAKIGALAVGGLVGFWAWKKKEPNQPPEPTR